MYVLELTRIPWIFLATCCPNFPGFHLIEGCMIEISPDFDTYMRKMLKKSLKIQFCPRVLSWHQAHTGVHWNYDRMIENPPSNPYLPPPPYVQVPCLSEVCCWYFWLRRDAAVNRQPPEIPPDSDTYLLLPPITYLDSAHTCSQKLLQIYPDSHIHCFQNSKISSDQRQYISVCFWGSWCSNHICLKILWEK